MEIVNEWLLCLLISDSLHKSDPPTYPTIAAKECLCSVETIYEFSYEFQYISWRFSAVTTNPNFVFAVRAVIIYSVSPVF